MGGWAVKVPWGEALAVTCSEGEGTEEGEPEGEALALAVPAGKEGEAEGECEALADFLTLLDTLAELVGEELRLGLLEAERESSAEAEALPLPLPVREALGVGLVEGVREVKEEALGLRVGDGEEEDEPRAVEEGEGL